MVSDETHTNSWTVLSCVCLLWFLTFFSLTDQWSKFPNQARLVLQLRLETSDLALQSLERLLDVLLPAGEQDVHVKQVLIYVVSPQKRGHF